MRRTLEELAPFRAGLGKSATPDLDEEDALRARVAALSGERQRLSSQLDGLATAVLELASAVPREGSQAGDNSIDDPTIGAGICARGGLFCCKWTLVALSPGPARWNHADNTYMHASPNIARLQ